MTLQPLQSYLGKSMDATGSVVAMLTTTMDKYGAHYLECATGRPFATIAPVDNSALWLVPWVKPLVGLINALKLVGSDSEVLPLPDSDSEWGDFWSVVARWLVYTPVAIGPLDRLRLWDQLEDRYYHNGGYFIVAIRQTTEGFIVHDPQGCPLRLLTVEDIIGISRTNSEMAAIRTTSTLLPISATAILEQALVVCDQAAKSANAGGTAIRALAERVRQGLRVREQIALSLGLAARGLSLVRIAEFLSSVGLNGVMDDHRRVCADAHYALRHTDSDRLIKYLFALAKHEENMDTILEAAMHSMSKQRAPCPITE